MTKNSGIAIRSLNDWFIRLLTEHKLLSQDATLTTPVVFLFRRFRKTAKSEYEFRHVCLSVRPSVCPHGKLGSHWKDFNDI